MLDKKAVLTRQKIKTNMLHKKAFLNSYEDNSFFITNSNNQGLMRSKHFFGCIFYHLSKTKKSC